MFPRGLSSSAFPLFRNATRKLHAFRDGLAVLSVLTLLFSGQVKAQAPILPHDRAESRQRATVQSTLVIPESVVFDVNVFDKRGKPVSGLTKEDFTVLEDGQKVDIASFAPMDLESAAQDRPAEESHLVLVFDDLWTAFGDAARTRYAISDYFTRRNGKLAQPTMLLGITEKGLVVLHDYTRDGNALNASLKKLPPHSVYPYKHVYARSANANEYQGDFAILRQLTEALDKISGHKTVVWISSGGLWSRPGDSPGKRANLLLSGVLFESRTTLSTLFPRSTLQYLNRGAVGAWDLSASENFYKASMQKVSESGSLAAGTGLGTLVYESGGMNLFGGRVDKELNRILAAASTFYTITYKPRATATTGEFHRITVEVNRPGLTIYARKGYYGIPFDPGASVPSKTTARMERVLANP